MLRTKKQIQREMRRLVGTNQGFGKLTTADARYHVQWKAASGHPRGWRVVCGISPLVELNDKLGRLIIFKSSETARKRAQQLNDLERSR
jgi:hypothetical protein